MCIYFTYISVYVKYRFLGATQHDSDLVCLEMSLEARLLILIEVCKEHIETNTIKPGIKYKISACSQIIHVYFSIQFLLLLSSSFQIGKRYAWESTKDIF